MPGSIRAFDAYGRAAVTFVQDPSRDRRRSISVEGAGDVGLPLILGSRQSGREKRRGSVRVEIKAFERQRRKKDTIIARHAVKWLLEIETRVGRFTNPSSHPNWIPSRQPANEIVSRLGDYDLSVASNYRRDPASFFTAEPEETANERRTRRVKQR